MSLFGKYMTTKTNDNEICPNCGRITFGPDCPFCGHPLVENRTRRAEEMRSGKSPAPAHLMSRRAEVELARLAELREEAEACVRQLKENTARPPRYAPEPTQPRAERFCPDYAPRGCDYRSCYPREYGPRETLPREDYVAETTRQSVLTLEAAELAAREILKRAHRDAEEEARRVLESRRLETEARAREIAEQERRERETDHYSEDDLARQLAAQILAQIKGEAPQPKRHEADTREYTRRAESQEKERGPGRISSEAAQGAEIILMETRDSIEKVRFETQKACQAITDAVQAQQESIRLYQQVTEKSARILETSELAAQELIQQSRRQGQEELGKLIAGAREAFIRETREAILGEAAAAVALAHQEKKNSQTVMDNAKETEGESVKLFHEAAKKSAQIMAASESAAQEIIKRARAEAADESRRIIAETRKEAELIIKEIQNTARNATLKTTRN
jgi:hypothetical protein